VVRFYAIIGLFWVVTIEFVGLANNTFHENISGGVTYLLVQTSNETLNLNKTQLNVTGSLKFGILPHPQFKTSPLSPSNTDKIPYSFWSENGKESLQNIYNNNSNNEGDSAL
jgi:hypothetical protein